jgi:hypothetical protein
MAEVVENVFRAALGADASPAQQPQPAPGSSPKGPKGPDDSYDPRKWTKSKALTTMRMFNCCNGCCLVIAAVIAFLVPGGSSGSILPSFDSITLSAYTVLLGLLMMCAECNMAMLQRKLRSNFGFLFTYAGRAAFIFFTATVAVALGGKTNFLMWSVGGATGLNAIFNLIVICKHPSFVSGEVDRYADPSASASTAEQAVAAYVRQNPQLAAQALAGTFAVTAAAGGGAAAGAGAGVAMAATAAAAAPAAAAASGGGGGGVGFASFLPSLSRAGRVAKAATPSSPAPAPATAGSPSS